MKNSICLLALLAFAFSFIPFSTCLALHDDETVKSGDAWRSDIAVGPGRSGSDDKIDENLRKAFKRSPIVIPPLEDDKNTESSSGDPVNKKANGIVNADDAGETGSR
jgi:hypothetical protein